MSEYTLVFSSASDEWLYSSVPQLARQSGFQSDLGPEKCTHSVKRNSCPPWRVCIEKPMMQPTPLPP